MMILAGSKTDGKYGADYGNDVLANSVGFDACSRLVASLESSPTTKNSQSIEDNWHLLDAKPYPRIPTTFPLSDDADARRTVRFRAYIRAKDREKGTYSLERRSEQCPGNPKP
jgi:hypothetical protein